MCDARWVNLPIPLAGVSSTGQFSRRSVSQLATSRAWCCLGSGTILQGSLGMTVTRECRIDSANGVVLVESWAHLLPAQMVGGVRAIDSENMAPGLFDRGVGFTADHLPTFLSVHHCARRSRSQSRDERLAVLSLLSRLVHFSAVFRKSNSHKKTHRDRHLHSQRCRDGST